MIGGTPSLWPERGFSVFSLGRTLPLKNSNARTWGSVVGRRPEHVQFKCSSSHQLPPQPHRYHSRRVRLGHLGGPVHAMPNISQLAPEPHPARPAQLRVGVAPLEVVRPRSLPPPLNPPPTARSSLSKAVSGAHVDTPTHRRASRRMPPASDPHRSRCLCRLCRLCRRLSRCPRLSCLNYLALFPRLSCMSARGDHRLSRRRRRSRPRRRGRICGC
jgi:hypothetical protein